MKGQERGEVDVCKVYICIHHKCKCILEVSLGDGAGEEGQVQCQDR